MRAEILQVDEPEVGGAVERGLHRAEGRHAASRKNEGADEVAGTQIPAVAPVRHGDRLEQHRSVGAEQGGAFLEESGQALVADRLDHLDRDQLVERAVEVAVIPENDLHAVPEPAGRDPPAGFLQLPAREGGGGDPASVARGGVDGEAPPAAADLDHVVARAESELAADAIELLDRRFAEVAGRSGEDPRRVGHGLVEEEREECVAEVVMGAGVSAAAGAAVPVQAVPEPFEGAGYRRETGLHPVQVAGIAKQEGEERGEVVAVPLPFHVGARRADPAAGQDAAVDAGRAHPEPDVRRRAAVFIVRAGPPDAPGVLDLQDAAGDRREPAAQPLPAPPRDALPRRDTRSPRREPPRRDPHGRTSRPARRPGWGKNGVRLSHRCRACQ